VPIKQRLQAVAHCRKILAQSDTAGLHPHTSPTVSRRASQPHSSADAAMLSDHAWERIGSSLKLSGQELRILRGIFNDQTESSIALELNVSPHTVHTHCERLYRKVEVSDRVKLILRVMREFLALTTSPGGQLPPLCAVRATGGCPFHQPRVST
jgi:DNA-binding NarL/FixJ family response regulator